MEGGVKELRREYIDKNFYRTFELAFSCLYVRCICLFAYISQSMGCVYSGTFVFVYTIQIIPSSLIAFIFFLG